MKFFVGLMARKSDERPELRTPKGTLDYSPEEVLTQCNIIENVVGVFRKHGGVPIETPTFELRSVLTNKYGEDSKLIYNLEDQGGDICSLRYDLTVPFARYLSTNRISRMRRYQVGRVYRRDNPSFKTGRLREFIQADFDICGDGVPMLADAEALSIISEILEGTKKKYIIRVNDRRIIMGMLKRCGISPESNMSICSTIDKADKLSWEELEKEFVSKGLDALQIAYIRIYMEARGSNEDILGFLEGKRGSGVEGVDGVTKVVDTIDESDSTLVTEEPDSTLVTERLNSASIAPNSSFNLKNNSDRASDDPFCTAIEDLKVLLKYSAILGVQNMKIDLSLARGLDYYTGMIIEASIIGGDVGSVIGGGRYDNLCRSMSKHTVPCVGFSVGISRLCAITELLKVNRGVFVGSAHGLLVDGRLGILEELWKAGVMAETFPGRRVNFKEQLENASKQNFRVAVFTGEDEESKGILRIINVESGESESIPRGELLRHVLARTNIAP